ncbi:peptide deformylase [Candidatus Vidania fulgoroideorum]
MIIYYPSNILRQIAKPIPINFNVDSIILNMKQKLLMFSGLGISAPQLGYSVRILTIIFKSRLVTFINPVIRYMSSSFYNSIEGCLSIPNYYVSILRSRYVLVDYLDINYNPHSIFLKGILSSCLQHEIDHLNGILIIDRI